MRTWRVRLAAAALVVVGAWMLIDGVRGLAVGDYVTPAEGAHAGQLGPWAAVVEALGVPPRSTAMMAWFVAQGALTLAIAAGVVLQPRRFRAPALVAGVALAWYLPFGTLGAAVVAACLFRIRHRVPR